MNYSSRFINKHPIGYRIAGIIVGFVFLIAGIIIACLIPEAWPALLVLGGIGLFLIIGHIIGLVKNSKE